MNMMRFTILVPALLMATLVACDQAGLVKSLTPAEDEQIARGYIDLLRQNAFEKIENDLDPSIKTASIRDELERMARTIPSEEPQSVKVVGVNTHHGSDSYQSNITFEYQFPGLWLLTNVAVQRKGGVSTIIGFNVAPIPDSLENLNRFTLRDKNALQYTVLAVAIVNLLFILYVLVRCFRTRIEKRKWLWILFVGVGIGNFTIDWTTGQWSFTPFAIQLLGGSAFAPPYGAWLLSVAFPLGAILFLMRKKNHAEIPE